MSSTKQLHTLPVQDLELGMVVHGIAQQSGNLVVKNKGMVRNLALIEQLQSNGVKTVLVEVKSKQSLPKILDASANIANVHDDVVADEMRSQTKRTSFRAAMSTELSIELEQAEKLIKQGDILHENFVQGVKGGIAQDLGDAKELVSDVYASLVRNPNALLCMTMIMNSKNYLASHAIHVATLLCFIGQKLELSINDCERLALLGYLYDIGMCKIPQEIISKNDVLSDEERAIVETHVQHSLDIVSGLGLDKEVLLAIEQHHERLDGSGYPNGFSGSNIGKFSRLLAIADTYEALTAGRLYRKPKTPAAAMKYLCDPHSGFDQKLVLQFVRHLGVYPVGSLVMLSNRRIAIVTKGHTEKANQPQLKVFYSVTGGHYLAPKIYDLSKQSNNVKILKPILASQYNLDIAKVV